MVWRNRAALRLLIGLALATALVPGSRAWEIRPVERESGAPLPPVAIGSAGDFKDYFRFDRGCRFRLMGPGELSFYARAHADSAQSPPESVWVALHGVSDGIERNWALGVAPSAVSAYADGRGGQPTSAAKVALALPEGLQDLALLGASDTGGEVYAVLYYDGPPASAVPPPAGEPRAAEPPAGAKPAPGWAFAADFSLEMIYDDNICRYSDATLAAFRRGDDPEQFAIETDDDFILCPVLDLSLSRPLLAGRPAALRAGYKNWQYARNDIKNNEEISVGLRQDVRAGDYLDLAYTYAPLSYIKELTDRPPFVSRTVPREYLHFGVARNAFTMAYRWRAARWLAVKVDGGRTLRFYNRPFLENDLWEWSTGVTGYLYYRRMQVWLDYGYADVLARGYDSVGETREDTDNHSDGSYEKDSYRIRVTYRPRSSPYRPRYAAGGWPSAVANLGRRVGAAIDRGLVAAKLTSIYAEVTYSRQFYTSREPLHVDPGHVGRLDETNQVRIGWATRPLWRQLSLDVGWRYTARTAKAPAGLIGEDDPSEEKDYTGNRYWVTLQYPLN